MKLFDNPKSAVALIVVFILLFLLFLAKDANAGDSEVYFSGGYAALRGETPAIGLHLRWPEAGPGTTDLEAGFVLSGQSEHYRENPNAITVYGLLVPNYGPFELGLGLGYTNVDWEYTCKETFVLAAGYRFKRATLRWYHFSSAGSCKPNAGRDIPMLGIRWGWAF